MTSMRAIKNNNKTYKAPNDEYKNEKVRRTLKKEK